MKRKYTALIILFILYLCAFIEKFREANFNIDYFIPLAFEYFIYFLILTFIVSIIPFIFWILNKADLKYFKGRKICIINSIIYAIIIFIYFLYLFFNNRDISILIGGIIISLVFALLYYFINMLLFVESKSETLYSSKSKSKETIFDEFKTNIVINSYKKINCKVCGKETMYNEYGTCSECHAEILRRLEEKEKQNN